MKKILLLLAFGPSLITAQTVKIDGINYELTPTKVGTATVTTNGLTGTYKDFDTIIIPPIIYYEEMEYKVTEIGANAFYACTAKYIELPNTIKTIGIYAFKNCNIERINIPESVTTINRNAFQFCNNLQRVDITNIENWLKIDFDIDGSWYPEDERPNPVFYAKHLYLNNEELKELTIPEGITDINTYAFAGLSSLESIEFGKDVTSIKDYSFQYCESLKSIIIPDNVTSIGVKAFDSCTALESIYLSREVEELPKGMFANCTSLEMVRIPENVKMVGYDCFKGCKKLKTVFIEDGIDELKDGAFEDCENLKDFYCYCINPPKAYTLNYKDKIIDYVFSGSYTDYATLHVPMSALDAYRSKAPWNLFGNIVAITDNDTAISSVSSQQTATPIQYFTFDGRMVTSPTSGNYIVRMSDGTTRKIIIRK